MSNNESSSATSQVIGFVVAAPILALLLPFLCVLLIWVICTSWNTTLENVCDAKQFYMCDSINLEKSRVACEEERKLWTPVNDYYCDYANAGGKGYYYVTRKPFPPSFAK